MLPPREIVPLPAPPRAVVRVPGSKSLTNRCLLLAAFAQPTETHAASVLRNALDCDDTALMIEALRSLGFAVQADWRTSTLTLPCLDRADWAKAADLFCGNSGTTLRFLTAALATGRGQFRLDGSPRMRQRPIQPLLDALHPLGCHARTEANNGCPPVLLDAQGLAGGRTTIRGDASSQFLSGLLMAAPLARAPVEIALEGKLVSWPYVAMTLELMRQWGVEVEEIVAGNQAAPADWRIAPQLYRADTYVIEPDATAASYFWAAAAITGGTVTVPGLPLRGSLQGDVAFTELLRCMGCTLADEDFAGLTVTGGPLRGIEAEMTEISDTVMTLAAVALFAEGPTTIRGVAHIRRKESDRLAALASELRKLGAEVIEFPDGLKILPRPLRGAELDPHDDHRLAMSFALVGLRVPGVVIRDPGCVAKTYPRFFEDLDKLRPACDD